MGVWHFTIPRGENLKS